MTQKDYISALENAATLEALEEVYENYMFDEECFIDFFWDDVITRLYKRRCADFHNERIGKKRKV